VCITFLILGISLLAANIWIVFQYQKKKRAHKEEEVQKKALEEFSEKFEGVQVLFNDFEDESFAHQAALVFFSGRNALFCLVIASLDSKPVVQAAILLLLDLCLVVYYLIKRPLKSSLDFTEQLLYELILLIVNVCFLIMAIADAGNYNTPGLIRLTSEIVIVLNIICKFVPFIFLGIRLALALWEYLKLTKLAIQSEMNKSRKKKKIFKRKTSMELSSTHTSRPLTSESSSLKFRLDASNSLMIETNGIVDQDVIAENAAMVQLDFFKKKRKVKKMDPSVVIPVNDDDIPQILADIPEMPLEMPEIYEVPERLEDAPEISDMPSEATRLMRLQPRFSGVDELVSGEVGTIVPDLEQVASERKVIPVQKNNYIQISNV